jgi:hypothetical protein
MPRRAGGVGVCTDEPYQAISCRRHWPIPNATWAISLIASLKVSAVSSFLVQLDFGLPGASRHVRTDDAKQFVVATLQEHVDE